jgi:aminoglycoside/choline kinase family phosphotransferase
MIDSTAVPETSTTDPRRQAALRWLQTLPRYFRIDHQSALTAAGDTGSLIVMDAPPDKEDCQAFVQVADLLLQRGVLVPRILAADLRQGFLLLSDLGSTTYGDAIGDAALAGPVIPDATVTTLYQQAIDTLVRIQTPSGAKPDLPLYDPQRLHVEMQLFSDWYVARHRQGTLSDAEQAALQAVFRRLSDAACAQGQVLVHRDYHCRNLMVLPHGQPGVLDFQDAVIGPVTYDLVSLLRDAYVTWPEDLQIDWAVRYWEQARRAGLPVPARFDVFWQDYEWMGLQRSLKVLGIFARLYHRDGKDRYLADIPRVLRHAQTVARRYDVFAPLARLLDRLHDHHTPFGYTF